MEKESEVQQWEDEEVVLREHERLLTGREQKEVFADQALHTSAVVVEQGPYPSESLDSEIDSEVEVGRSKAADHT